MAAGTKQKGAEMTRVIGEEAVTVTGLRIQSRGQLLQDGDRFRALSAYREQDTGLRVSMEQCANCSEG